MHKAIDLCTSLFQLTMVCTRTSQLTDPSTGKIVAVNTKEGAKVSAAIADAKKKIKTWRSKH
jgi:hypothetical protein